jgi:hypothetical protein
LDSLPGADVQHAVPQVDEVDLAVPVAVGGVVPVADRGIGRSGRDGLGRSNLKYVERIGASKSGRAPMRRYPIRKVTTPVPVEGGVEGGALPMSAGTSFHGRRKPNGSACQRRTMAGVQDEAKHAMSAMSPLKSWRSAGDGARPRAT